MNARLTIRSRTAVAALATLAVLGTIGITACSDSRDPISPVPTGLRPEANPSHLVRTNVPSIAMLSFQVQSAMLPFPFLYDIPLTNGGTGASLSLPAGKAYTITVKAYDRYGNQTHVGGLSLASVVPGTNPGLELSLKPVTDSVQVATIDVSVVGETLLPAGGKIIVKAPSSVEQGDDNVSMAAEVVGPDGTVIPLNPGDLHWALSDPSAGTVTPDPVQPRNAHFSANAPHSTNVVVLYHNYGFTYVNLYVIENAFTKISAAGNYTCGLRLTGALSCWGENNGGMLGASDASLESSGVGVPCTSGSSQTCVTKPLHLAVGHFFTDLSTGATNACAIEQGTGLTWCWGYNTGGQLGVGSTASVVPPTPLTTTLQFQKISAGMEHVCGISNGTGYCWGDNSFGELGNGLSTSYTGGGGTATPQPLGSGWTQISAGEDFTCGIQNSVAKCWGGNSSYLIGAGWLGTSPAIVSPRAIQTPFAPAVPSQLGIASDGQSMCAIIPAGAQQSGPWCWGFTMGSEAYNIGGIGQAYTPTAIPGAGSLTQVANGFQQSCGLDSSGNVYCWGWNMYGATGVRSSGYTTTATRLNANGLTFTSITAGDNHVCGIESSGLVYCWGWNGYAQFGDNDQEVVGITAPTQVWGTVTL